MVKTKSAGTATQATVVDETAHSAPKFTRNAPKSTINKILDFLMFFNNGKVCANTHQFIYSHFGDDSAFNSDDKAALRYKFYDLAAYLVNNKEWNVRALEDALDAVIELETKCADSPNYGKTKNRWTTTKMSLVFQIGLAILRETIDLVDDDLPEDHSDLSFPNQIAVPAYERRVEQLFNQFVDVYTNEDGEENEKYEYHVQGLSDNIIETVATANKGKKSAAKKQVLSKQRVHELLSKHRLDSAVRHLLHFVQSMETTILPVPLDMEVRELRDNETVASALKRLAHKPDWNDYQAETAGPYASPASKARARFGSAGRTSLSSRIADDDDDHYGAVEEAVHREAPAAPAHTKATPLRPNSVSATRSPVAKAAPTVAPGSVTAASERLKRKYDQMDPLTAALGPDSAAAKARVSGEAKLSASKAAAAVATAAPASISKSVAQVQSPKAAAKGPASKNTAPVASKKGEKVMFSDSESEDIVDTDEDSTTNRPAVHALLQMKQQSAAAKPPTHFPDRLDSPQAVRRASSSGGAGGRTRSTNAAAAGSGRGQGKGRTRWTFEEEEALTEAVGTFGEGNWAAILNDPEYFRVFSGRTNVNLKDKWRNMCKDRAPC